MFKSVIYLTDKLDNEFLKISFLLKFALLTHCISTINKIAVVCHLTAVRLYSVL